jgi:SAM-dependent methyltransferase
VSGRPGDEFAGRTFTVPRQREGGLAAVVARHVDAGAPLRVLDLGCGTGGQVLALAESLPRARLTGIDISGPSIAAARKTVAGHPAAGRVEFAVADYLRFTGGPFDVVISETVLHAIPVETEALFAKLAADLVRGGLLVYTMPTDALYNRALCLVRRGARALRGPALDAALLAVARALHGRRWDEDLLRERIPYMYVVPFRWDSAALHARMAERWGLSVLATEPVPHASPAQFKHRLVVARRGAAG